MGIVYLARDRQLELDVAVKVLPPELEEDIRAVKRLKNEALAAMRLSHPNIMRLYNFEETIEARFLVMEYIDGPNLLKVLHETPGGKIDPKTFGDYASQICAGLAYAHRNKVVHGDLKPANIMINSSGEIKITDFGIAQIVKETVTRVSKMEVAGTLVYMAPEQHEGLPGDDLSDQYSLGVTFYELLAGEPPFSRGNITYQHLHKRPKHLEDVPIELDACIRRSLGKKPEERWADVETFGKALRGEVPVDFIDPLADDDLDDLTPRTGSKILKALAFLLLVGLTVGGYFYRAQIEQYVRSLQAQPNTDSLAAVADSLRLRRLETAERDRLQRIELLTSQISNAISYMNWELAEDALARLGATDSAMAVAWLDTLNAARGPSEEVVPTGSIMTLRGHTGPVRSVIYTPDGQYVISAGGYEDNTIKVWRASDGQLVHTLSGHTLNVRAVAVSPDGQYVVSGSLDQTVRIWRISDGQLVRTLEGHTGMVLCVMVTHNGRYVVSGAKDPDNTVRVWSMQDGTLVQTFRGHTAAVTSLAQTGNGFFIISGSEDNTVRVWRMDTGTLARTFTGHTNYVHAVAVTPDSNHVVSAGLDRTIRFWRISDSRNYRTLGPFERPISALTITPDARYLLVSPGEFGGNDKALHIVEKRTGETTGLLEGHESWVFCSCVSPDGSRVATGSGDTTVRIWYAPGYEPEPVPSGAASDTLGSTGLTPPGAM